MTEKEKKILLSVTIIIGIVVALVVLIVFPKFTAGYESDYDKLLQERIEGILYRPEDGEKSESSDESGKLGKISPYHSSYSQEECTWFPARMHSKTDSALYRDTCPVCGCVY